MKTQIAATVFAAILPLCAHASQPQPFPLVINCAHRGVPSRAEVSRFTGVDNFTQAYAMRARLMQQAANQCRQGVSHVALVMQTLDPDRGLTRQVAATDPSKR